MIDWVNLQKTQDDEAIIKILKMIKLNKLPKGYKQKNKLGSYFPRLNSEKNAFINFDWHGKDIQRFIAAFSYPYSGANTFIGNHKIKFLKSKFISNKKMNKHPFFNGIVFEIKNKYFFIFVVGGYLKINHKDIITDYSIKLGDRLYTPNKFLESSFVSRIKYDAKGIK